MKKIYLCIFIILFAVLLVGGSIAADEAKKNPENEAKNDLLKQSVHRNIEYFYLQSLVPSVRFVPRLSKYQRSHESYLNFFESSYPKLKDGFINSGSDRLYDVSKYNHKPRVYYGMAPYLRLLDLMPKDKEYIKQDVDLQAILKKNSLTEHFEITDDVNAADVYVLPVLPYSYLRISNPDVIKSPLIRKNKYENVLFSIKNIFFNLEIMTLNPNGLTGAIVKDGNGSILASYCPVDITESQETIERDVFYCLIQSAGLPGFYETFPEYNQRTVAWAGLLASVHNCEVIKPKQNYFQILFSSSLFETCLSQGDYENATNSP